jgi:sugar phosphate isomerase/epimerase
VKRISIGSWAYSIGPYQANPVPFDEVIDRVAALGFDGIELGGFPPHPNPEALPTREERQALSEKVRAKGLEWSGLAADLWSHRLIDTDDCGPYVDAFRKNLDFCADLGIRTIRVDTIQPPTVFDAVDEETARRRVVSAWQQCARRAADRGIHVVWEFEPGFAFNKPSDIVRILEEVDEPNFKALFDTCHAHMVAAVGARQPGRKETLPGGALELARKLRGKIGHVHIIDSDSTLHDDETSTHAPFGDGVIDFMTLLPELDHDIPANGWWTIDLCFWPDAWVVTEKCKRAIDDLNAKLESGS